MKKIVLLMSFLTMSAFAQTANTTNSPQGSKGDRPPISAEMKAAFEACKSSGKPGDTAFDSCMSSKGFTKPTGAPPQGGHPHDHEKPTTK